MTVGPHKPAGPEAELAPLFEPLSVGSVEVRNRIAHPAVVGNLGAHGLPTDALVAYYESRARGGAGLIVTEGMSVHPSSQPNPAVVHVYDEAARDGLVRLAAGVKSHGAAVLMQLWHVGRQQLWGPTVTPWGMSELPDALSGGVPHVMTTAEIGEVIDSFVACARTAEECGFDGVEIHGAHGYLITQSLSPWSNTRADEYGASVEGRMRLVRRILQRIREACGPAFVLGLKLSGSEFVAGGLTAEDTAAIVAELSGEGLVDLFAIGQGNFSVSLEKHVPDMRFPQAPFIDMIREIRRSSTVPVMALGRFIDPQVGADAVSSGAADLVGMGRALISDPDAPNKWAGTDPEPVRRCISCNECWNSIHRGRQISCIHRVNVVGPVPSYEPGPTRRRVAVVGGGPAGMEAAWVAANRGHDVTLFEQASALGGAVRLLAEGPGLSEFAGLLDYQEAQLKRFGVRVELGTRIEPGYLAENADAVIVATGSKAQPPPAELRGLPVWIPQDESWVLALEQEPGPVLVFDEDGGYYAYGPLLQLAEAGWAVTLVTSRLQVGDGLGHLARIGLERDLRARGVQVLTGLVLSAITDGHLVVEDCLTRSTTALPLPAGVVWAGPRAAVDELWRDGDVGAITGRPVGDAWSPRGIRAAIHEGHHAGASV
jgi:2,4-dienoyl-CoA reductase-like NADH-dependent reductase (Old Yellow Enzyme family)